MLNRRTDRVGRLLQMELGRIMTQKMKDSGLGFVTITSVDVSSDLKSACVFYSVLGNDEVKEKTHAALEHSAKYFQREIASVVTLKNTPKLIFKLDHMAEYQEEVDHLLNKIKKENSEKKSNEDNAS